MRPRPVAVPAAAIAAPVTSLSEVQRLKADNFQLRIHIAELRATLADRENRLASAELSAVEQRLIEEFRETLGAAPDAVFDWPSRTFARAEPT